MWIFGLLIILIFFGAPTLLGVYLIRKVRQRKKREAEENTALGTYESALKIPHFSRIWLTYFFLGLFAIIYCCEALLSSGQQMTAQQLLAMGGISNVLLFTQHEWYRIFTAPFLHANLNHIISNAIGFFFAGIFIEKHMGRAWFFTIFIMSAICGSLMSVWINPAMLISVGASGVIMGLFAAIFILCFRLSSDDPRQKKERLNIQYYSLRVLIPSLWPLLSSSSAGGEVDYACHLGGAIGGAVLGLWLLKTWPKDMPKPPHFAFTRFFVIFGVLALVVSGLSAIDHYGYYKRLLASASQLMPQEEIVKINPASKTDFPSLIAKYPTDGRLNFLYALSLTTSDLAAAENQLRITQTKVVTLAPGILPSNFDGSVRGVLAEVLMKEGKKDEAVSVANSLCNLPDEQKPRAELYKHVMAYASCK